MVVRVRFVYVVISRRVASFWFTRDSDIRILRLDDDYPSN
ncbi:hypothetical protein NJ7G_3979 [Natrinema sp. J7-2]|nr:hypothetical protein NJ7G_3979 [Natrinema sp. J7-2]